MAAIQDLSRVLPCILPKDDAYTASILWHNDLHTDNIFVDAHRPTEITGIIDWQAVHLAPAFLHVHYPSLIENDGPILDLFVLPKLPDNFIELEPDAQKAAQSLKTAQLIWGLDQIFTHKEAPGLFRVLRYRDSLACQIMSLAGSIFDDGEAYVRSLLVRLAEQETWGKVVRTAQTIQGPSSDEALFVPPSCPLAYSADQIDQVQNELALWERDVQRKAGVIEELGAYTGWDGAMVPGQYDDMVVALERARLRFLEGESKSPEEREAWAAAWPFRAGWRRFEYSLLFDWVVIYSWEALERWDIRDGYICWGRGLE